MHENPVSESMKNHANLWAISYRNKKIIGEILRLISGLKSQYVSPSEQFKRTVVKFQVWLDTGTDKIRYRYFSDIRKKSKFNIRL